LLLIIGYKQNFIKKNFLNDTLIYLMHKKLGFDTLLAMTKDKTKQGWQEFLELCMKIEAASELNEFFNLFLTIEEKETLVSRYLIVKSMLEGKLTQREISKKHKVSIAQITRGSNALKIISSELREKLKERLIAS